MTVAGVNSRPTSWPRPSTAATVLRQKDAPRTFAPVMATESIAAGSTNVARGSIGITVCISHDEIEVDFYEPRHVIVFADASQLQLK